MSAAAETAKLARLLGVEPDRLDYLAEVPEDDLRELRDRATDVLFDANRALFERVAAASKLVPTAVTVAVAQKAFGPLLCARVTGALEPERAVEIAGRLPVDFLADVAVELDPRRAGAVLAKLPAAQVAEVGAELARRGDFVTMGRFVGSLPSPSLRATVEALDAESILRTAAFSEGEDDRADEIFAMIPDALLSDIAAAAASAPDDLAEHLAAMFAGLDEAGRARLSAALDGLDSGQRARLAKLAGLG